MQEKFQSRNKSFMSNSDFFAVNLRAQEARVMSRKSFRLNTYNKYRIAFQSTEDSQISVSTLEEGISNLFSQDLHQNIKGAYYIRKILGIDFNPPVQKIIDAGVLPVLINFIKRFDCPDLQYESAWAISNIAASEHEFTMKVVEKGAVPFIIDLFSSPFDHIKEQAIWIIGNITGDSSSFSEFISHYGGISKLIQVIENSKSEYLIKAAVWALGNACKGERAPEYKVIKDALAVFCKLLTSSDEEVLQSSLWVIASVTEHSEEAGNTVIKAGMLTKIVEFLKHTEYNIKLPSVLIVGRIAAGTDSQTSAVIEAGALAALVPLLDSPQRNIRKESLWCYSNISAGSEAHIQSMMDLDIFRKMIRILYRDDAEVKIEALWALANAAGKGNKTQVGELVKSGLIQALIHCLSSNDAQFLLVVLLGVRQVLQKGTDFATESGVNPYVVIFEESNGTSVLEKLQKHHNFKVLEEVYKILTEFFDAQCEDQDLVDLITSSDY